MNEPPAPWPIRLASNAAQQEHNQHIHALRTPLTEVILRVNLLRRHLRRGDAPERLDAELDQIDQGLARLVAAIAHFDETRQRDP